MFAIVVCLMCFSSSAGASINDERKRKFIGTWLSVEFKFLLCQVFQLLTVRDSLLFIVPEKPLWGGNSKVCMYVLDISQ